MRRGAMRRGAMTPGAAALLAAILSPAVALAHQPSPAGAGFAQAGSPCGTREAVLDHLARHYDELPVAVGLTAGGGMIELLTDPSGASWTLIVTSPRGTSCLVTAGEAWRRLDRKSAEPGA